jgi:hypothetical protein
MTPDPVRYEPITEPVDHEPRGCLFLGKESEALLRTTLAEAGVELGEYDDLILRWLAMWEFGTVAVVASWIIRAARSGSANTTDDLVQRTPANSPAHDADRDCMIETRPVSAGARYASAKQTRAALRRRQDASGTGRGPDVAEPGRAI